MRRKEHHLNVFARNDTRLESWFKGELLVLFDKLKREGIIDDFKVEYPDEKSRRAKIDFLITIEGKKHYLELKAPCISQSKTERNLQFYFRNNNVGIKKDFGKLDLINNKNKWVIAFIYPKPDEESWNEVTGKIADWKCLTNLKDYPSHIFIALFIKKHL